MSKAAASGGRGNHYFNEPATDPRAVGLPQTTGIDPSGGMVGGTIGCNYQFATNWVVGIENDISWMGNSASALGILPFFNPADTFQTRQTWLDTLRGRFGYAWDRVYLYGTGGVAFTDQNIQICDPLGGCASASSTVTGWTAGAGVEWAFYQDWSAKLESLHSDFGSTGYAHLPNLRAGFAARNVTLTDDIVRVGVNYRFNWGGPVLVRY